MKKMFAPERRQIILQKLEERQRITIKELSKEIQVSEATLRTDLSKMEEYGLLKRTHGGAMLSEHLDNDVSFSTRESKSRFEKAAIAQKAMELLKHGQCIMLDASSTALELAKIIRDTPIRLTVVTSGINTALELNANSYITVILLGGIMKKDSYSLEGNLGVDILNQINIDIMFTSANGFSLDSGLTDFSVYEVELKKAVVASSKKVVALLDHTKINKNSIASFAPIEQINTLITDCEITNSYIKELEEKGVEVIKVTVDEKNRVNII